MDRLQVEEEVATTTRIDSCRLVLEVDMEVEGTNHLSLLHRHGRAMKLNLVGVGMDMMLLLLDKGYRVDLLREGEVLDYQVVHEVQDTRWVWCDLGRIMKAVYHMHCLELEATTSGHRCVLEQISSQARS